MFHFSKKNLACGDACPGCCCCGCRSSRKGVSCGVRSSRPNSTQITYIHWLACSLSDRDDLQQPSVKSRFLWTCQQPTSIITLTTLKTQEEERVHIFTLILDWTIDTKQQVAAPPVVQGTTQAAAPAAPAVPSGYCCCFLCAWCIMCT